MARGKAGAPDAPRVRAPEPLNAQHDLSRFANGKHPSLDLWLRERAAVGEGFSARTYVVYAINPAERVVGYYAIATATEERAALPSAKLRRGMPEQVPLLLVGRLAIDSEFHGQGLGGHLLIDAVRRCVAASDIIGARGIVAHAIDEDAVRFYEKHDFMRCPLGERVMLLPIETARALLDE